MRSEQSAKYPDDKFSILAQYRSDVTYGENVNALAVALYSEGVMSNDRSAAFLNAEILVHRIPLCIFSRRTS